MQVPANVIKAGVGVLATGVITVVTLALKQHLVRVVHKVNKLWAGKRVAILGRQWVGKTTLLALLMGQDLSAARKTTVDPNTGASFELRIGKKTVRFRVRHDQPGWAPELAYKGWREEFDDADFVLYLFRADLIARGDRGTVALVERDLNEFKSWLEQRETGAPVPKVILIGTWADRSPEFAKDAAKFTSRIRKARPIKLGAIKLNKADLVVGSLGAEEDSAKLIASLGEFVR
ncbi:hypothetical protein [Microbacterium kunmingense]|uniref:GTPase domain-containing protein n=1 Tax=Microbacterium kunmingense TaxID=2915939 RepID=UPI003D72D20F